MNNKEQFSFKHWCENCKQNTFVSYEKINGEKELIYGKKLFAACRDICK